MDLRKIKKLIELLEESELAEMEITEGENTIRLSRAAMRPPETMPVSAPAPASSAAVTETAPTPAQSSPAPATAAVAAADEVTGRVIKSPLVGTFYNSSSPEDKPYVALGAVVGEGDTLCLIEAMKTFNQLEAEIAGTVTVIHKNNGDPVEYGEPLFVIEPQ